MKYTLVRHREGTSEFHARAVEVCAVSHAASPRRIRQAGGLLFHTYEQAHDACYHANYPPSNKGLTPHVRGGFVRVDQVWVYVPTPEATSGVLTQSGFIVHIKKEQGR